MTRLRHYAALPGAFVFATTVLLAPASAETETNPKDYTIHLVGHAHIDLSWLWRWEETVHDVCTNTFRGLLDVMDKEPSLTFAQSQIALYEAMEREHPDIFEHMKQHIDEGTWEIVGGMWCEPDCNMPAGEALVRQLLYGKRYVRDKFDEDVTVGWDPDTFGHCWSLPQILKKSGIKYYVFTRCSPEKTPVFWWQGIDGSRVLGYTPPTWYNASVAPAMKKQLLDWSKKSGLKDGLFLYGEGDHGGGPRAGDVRGYQILSAKPDFPKMQYSTATEYFKKITSLGVDFPVVKDELNFAFRGCYTTQSRIKQLNRKLENLLLTAEKFSSASRFAGLRPYYPMRDLTEAWKIVLRNQFHDILCGSSIGAVYPEVEKFQGEAEERGMRALDESLRCIGGRVPTSGEGIPVIVYNPLSWTRTDLVEVSITSLDPIETLHATSSDGKSEPMQVVRTSKEGDRYVAHALFVARDVPSVGYRLFRLMSGSVSASDSDLKASSNVLENEFYRVEVSGTTGRIVRLTDKLQSRDVIKEPGCGLAVVQEKEVGMSAWETSFTDTVASPQLVEPVQIVEKGPVQATIRVKTRFRDSCFTQDISLSRGVKRVDVRMTADWVERWQALKLVLPVTVTAEKATFEIPYGNIQRPTNGDEVPALNWIDLSDATCGVTLLNDCKYGFSVKGSMMAMTVLRGPGDPDPRADVGRHELGYAIVPHAGGWQQENAARRGYEFNCPLIGMQEPKHAGPLPVEYSFVAVEPENVVLTAMKDGEGYETRQFVLRLCETFGRKATATVKFPRKVVVEEADLMERRIESGVKQQGETITVTLEPYEIKTLIAG